jgi:pimeloyl-ACP methyl ester carboxylesterase
MRSSFIVIMILFFGGCSMKVPNTWKSKIEDNKIDNIKLYSRVEGVGDPIVMLHGFGTSSFSFRFIIPSLSEKYKVFALDLKGFGDSPKPRDGAYSVYDQALLVSKFIKDNNLKDIILVGHSFGGGVALSLALLEPNNIKAMILLDSASYKQKLPTMIRWLNIPILGKAGFYLLPSELETREAYNYAFFDDKKIPKESIKELSKKLKLKNARYAFCQTAQTMIPDDIDDISKLYSNITIPTLILWGNDDIVIKKSIGKKLHQNLSNSTLKIIHNCGHMPHEEKPKETVRLILSFLKNL